MPRRGGAGRGPGGGGRRGSFRSPSRPPSTPRSTTSLVKPPSMMRQMAATAGGVAAGTVLGHALLSAMSPGQRRDYYDSTYARATPRDLKEDPCGDFLGRLVACMKMAQESNMDVMEVCAKAESMYLECRKNKGDPTY